MKKYLALILALILACSLAACGGSSNSDSAPSQSVTYTESASEEIADDEDSFYSDSAESTSAQSPVYQNSDVKLIRNASLDMEATDLDQACADLENLVASLGGYLENSDVYQGGYHSNSYRYASYTARVPSEQYETFLSSLSDESVCHLVSRSEYTEDVGQQYADLETHLEMLNTKLERLNALLAEAEDMTDIITLENAITDTEYEIASYTSTRNTYDNLIGYSTFTIYINEVQTLTPVAERSFGSRLSTAFLDGCRSFAVGLQNLLIWISGHVLGLIVLAATVVAAVVILRRSKKRKITKNTEKEE